MINREILSRLVEENLETRVNKILKDQGFPSDSTRLLFRFISNIFSQLPPELIGWKFKVIRFIDKYDQTDKQIIHVENIKQSLQGECTIIMISETLCVFEDFNASFDGQAHISYSYFSPLNEQLCIGDEIVPLPEYYDSATSSIFAYPVYKELDEAINNYDQSLARNSVCNMLARIWKDASRKEFCEKPEQDMRNSLWQYLNSVLRNHTVKREQNVDESHPVDIKVTWPMVNNSALIEVKWLGDSGKTKHRDSRANTGAKQLIDYLQSSYAEEPDKNFIGYLTVFDGRRGKDTLNQYENIEINYIDEYRLHPQMKYYRFYLAECS